MDKCHATWYSSSYMTPLSTKIWESWRQEQTLLPVYLVCLCVAYSVKPNSQCKDSERTRPPEPPWDQKAKFSWDTTCWTVSKRRKGSPSKREFGYFVVWFKFGGRVAGEHGDGEEMLQAKFLGKAYGICDTSMLWSGCSAEIRVRRLLRSAQHFISSFLTGAGCHVGHPFWCLNWLHLGQELESA